MCARRGGIGEGEGYGMCPRVHEKVSIGKTLKATEQHLIHILWYGIFYDTRDTISKHFMKIMTDVKSNFRIGYVGASWVNLNNSRTLQSICSSGRAS